jgi:hypothetical protein
MVDVTRIHTTLIFTKVTLLILLAQLAGSIPLEPEISFVHKFREGAAPQYPGF